MNITNLRYLNLLLNIKISCSIFDVTIALGDVKCPYLAFFLKRYQRNYKLRHFCIFDKFQIFIKLKLSEK